MQKYWRLDTRTMAKKKKKGKIVQAAANAKENERVVISSNGKAEYLYEIVNRYVAGMKLTGTEVKAIRTGKVSLKDSFCYFVKGELWVKNLYIGEYKHGNLFNHEARRVRKLLLRKRELSRLESNVKEKGFSIVPTELFVSSRNFMKLEIALVKGKRKFDKRESIKTKDIKREMDREMRQRY